MHWRLCWLYPCPQTPDIDFISPVQGPTSGGFVVGVALDAPVSSPADAVCMFGSVSSPAALLAPRILECIAPSSPHGATSVDFYLRASNGAKSNILTFTYQ